MNNFTEPGMISIYGRMQRVGVSSGTEWVPKDASHNHAVEESVKGKKLPPVEYPNILDIHQQFYMWCCIQHMVPQLPCNQHMFSAIYSTFHPQEVASFPVSTTTTNHRAARRLELSDKEEAVDEKDDMSCKLKSSEELLENPSFSTLTPVYSCKAVCKNEGQSLLTDESFTISKSNSQLQMEKQQETAALESHLYSRFEGAQHKIHHDEHSTSSQTRLLNGTLLLSDIIELPLTESEPEIPTELQGPGGHVFLRMLSRSWRQYKRSVEYSD